MLALINIVHLQGFAMRFVRREKMREQLSLLPGSGEKEMEPRGPREWSPRLGPPRERTVYRFREIYTHSEITDCILLVRPYFRIVSGVVTRPTGHFHMKVDGEVVVNYEPLAKFWIGGSPWKYDPDTPIKPFKHSVLFVGGALNDQNEADLQLHYYGLMLPNASKIDMKVSDLEVGKGLTVEAGLIAAMYSTKAENEGEKEEPREIDGEGIR